MTLEVYTNGALRSARWWAELARRFKSLKVVFAIDGLEDTHAIYRRGTSFAKAAENARAFIAAGGRAQWDFLVFRHNERQVEEARRRARDWGFAAFVPKYSGRFYRGYYENDPNFKDDERMDRFPIHDKNRQVVGYLQPPSNAEYVNPVFEQMAAHGRRDGSLVPHWDATEICCSVIENRSLFVAADGAVLPCCWTYGASLNRTVYGVPDPLDNQMEELLRRCGGRAAVDGRRHSIREICKSELFREIALSWERESLAAGKLKVCARMCGRGFNQYKSQFADPQLAPGRRPAAVSRQLHRAQRLAWRRRGRGVKRYREEAAPRSFKRRLGRGGPRLVVRVRQRRPFPDESDDRPDLLVRRPGRAEARHARHLDAVLDDPEQLRRGASRSPFP